MDQILNSKKLTNNLIDILSQHEEPFTNREYQHINNLLALQQLNDPRFLHIIKKLINSGHQPIYIFEVKLFLKENDQELYECYRDSFKGNPGVEEGFYGEIKKANRDLYKKVEEIKEIKLLDPLYLVNKPKKRKDNYEKKKLRRDGKTSASIKINKVIEDKKEYDKKIKHMYGKINSNK